MVVKGRSAAQPAFGERPGALFFGLEARIAEEFRHFERLSSQALLKHGRLPRQARMLELAGLRIRAQ